MTAPRQAESRLVLREEELDTALELMMLADAALWAAADEALERDPAALGRGHFRAAFLLKRRPGLGVQELSRLTGLSKQGASRVLSELEKKGLVEKAPADGDARRKPARLTDEGRAFESRVAERMRAHLATAYKIGGFDLVPPARKMLAAVAGPRTNVGLRNSRG